MSRRSVLVFTASILGAGSAISCAVRVSPPAMKPPPAISSAQVVYTPGEQGEADAAAAQPVISDPAETKSESPVPLDAEQVLSTALERAEAEQKVLLVHVGAPG